MLNKISLFFIVMLLSANIAFASNDNSTAVQIVKQYLHKLNTQSESTVFTAINTKAPTNNPRFNILIYDFTGIVKAWSFIPTYVGKDISTFKDGDGNTALATLEQVAKTTPSGWFDFKVVDSTTNLPANIKSYYETFNNYIVICGYIE